MIHHFLRLKSWLLQFGVEENESEIYNAKARIFTYLICLSLSIQFFLFIKELITMDQTGITIISSFLVLNISLLALYNYKGLYIAATVYNVLYPTILSSYMIMVGRGDGVEYSFFIFMVTSVIFHKSHLVKFLLLAYCILLFILTTTYLTLYPPLLIRPDEQSDEIAMFIAVSICFFCIIYIFNKKLEQYYNQSQQLVVSLRQQNKKLVQVNNELERFTFIASHDLKTPLLNIITFSDLLEKKIRGIEDKEVKQYLSFIQDGGKRMNTLIENVLEYTEFTKSDQSLDLKKESTALNNIVEEVKTAISPYLISRNATIELIGLLPEIVWTKSKLFYLFKNLIENGLKYNVSANPVVKITSFLHGEYCSISFEDNGIGIKEEFQDEIFVMFKRLHNHSEYEGSGLGLPTCKKIVTEMGGQIHVESELGKKSVFIVDIPRHLLKNQVKQIEAVCA